MKRLPQVRKLNEKQQQMLILGIQSFLAYHKLVHRTPNSFKAESQMKKLNEFIEDLKSSPEYGPEGALKFLKMMKSVSLTGNFEETLKDEKDPKFQPIFQVLQRCYA